MSRLAWGPGSRRTKVAVTAAVLALVGALFALTTGGSAEAGGGGFPSRWPAQSTVPSVERGAGGPSQVLRLHEVTVREAQVDIDGDGHFDPGDGFLFQDKLINTRTGYRVGKDNVSCTGFARAFDCHGTINLRSRGKIVVDGTSWEGEGTVLAVTGGTYRYRGASGLMHVVTGPGGGERLIIELD